MPTNWKPFVYGGTASVVAECGTFPLDLTKTRLQVQGQKMEANFRELKYRGMFHALTKIAKEEGILALYSGIRPAILRQAVYGTIKIGCYHSFKRILVDNPENETLPVNVLCGMTAGVIASAIANPTDVLKVRMQAQSASFANAGGMFNSFVTIFQEEGTKGLWRGVVPTAQRVAIVAGVALPVYDWCKKTVLDRRLMEDDVRLHFLSSFMAGLAGAILSNPVDVVRTRLMNQRNLRKGVVTSSSSFMYRNSIECLLKTAKYEGFIALYKGFVPTWVRLGPWNIIFFITYEQLQRLPL
ncbi:kidney mitochondrial carrier protein 1-like [Lytechinus variegatus]|uniref:kidney mitochondrial carrier protein 1-like n=1 Tax=Lytechinus variegatus TaxID=7654 RepID=UPI001BB1A25F|nr:kidney mitochondrial carrier protein 1-like [Lytechinus variegatus]XP_054771441.1 kidney mitochondrial carrier protein 1-like [Lytechinus pictus]